MPESAPPLPTPVLRQPLRAIFRHRNYRLFFFGQLLSLMGSWMQTIGQAWLVYQLTGSPLALGLIGFLQQGPVFFFAVFGGTIADRTDRRKLIIATQIVFLLQAATLAVLTFTGEVQLWHVAVLAAIFGIANAVDIPARQSFTVELVGRDDLQSAISVNSMMFNIARVTGPAIAGILIAAVGEAWCFAVNAVSYVAVLTSLLLMVIPAYVKPTQRARPMQDLVEGFRYVTGNREIRTALLALAVTSFAGGPYMTLMPVFAQDVLGAGPDGYGLLMTMVGVGAFCGALTLSYVAPASLRLVPAAAAVMFGVSMMVLSLTSTYWIAALLILPTAFALMLQGSATNLTVQSNIDDRMRGRVMAYYTMAFLGMMPFGAFAAGALAHYIGVPITLTLGGAVCTLGGIAAWWLRKRRDVNLI